MERRWLLQCYQKQVDNVRLSTLKKKKEAKPVIISVRQRSSWYFKKSFWICLTHSINIGLTLQAGQSDALIVIMNKSVSFFYFLFLICLYLLPKRDNNNFLLAKFENFAELQRFLGKVSPLNNDHPFSQWIFIGGQEWWHTPLVLAAIKTETERVQVWSQAWQVSEILSQNKNIKKS